MTFISWLHNLAMLILNLALLAWVKIRFPDSGIGKVVSVLV